MGKKEKLLQKAKNSPSNLTFDELCLLAEKYGFVFRGQSGSHKIYRHCVSQNIMNFQPDNNKAKKYQVKQLLAFIEDHASDE
jgi:predicted RNA binding protein YcfA (HicA-like mRNA interferase family)